MHVSGFAPAPLTEVAPVTLDEVLYDFAYAELGEPGRWNQGAEQLRAYFEQLGDPASAPPTLRRQMIDAITKTREPMLGFLLDNPTTWVSGSFDVDALKTVRLTSWFEQDHRFANARTLGELVDTPGGREVYVKPGFSLDAMRGRPILIATNAGGPYCLIEGTSRCCEIMRLARLGKMPHARIPVYLGVCPNAEQYRTYQNGAPIVGAKPWWVPFVQLFRGTLLHFKNKTEEGSLVEAVGYAWLRIVDLLARNPQDVLQMKPEDFERLIAGAYLESRAFDDVTITPRSGDLGRDIIATTRGGVRVLDQVKLYKPGHLVDAARVRAIVGVGLSDSATKCVITTTSDFAPRLRQEPLMAPHMKNGFLELRDGEKTIEWIRALSRRQAR